MVKLNKNSKRKSKKNTKNTIKKKLKLSKNKKLKIFYKKKGGKPGETDDPISRSKTLSCKDKIPYLLDKKNSDERPSEEWEEYLMVAYRDLEDFENNLQTLKESPKNSLKYAVLDFEYLIQAKEYIDKEKTGIKDKTLEIPVDKKLKDWNKLSVAEKKLQLPILKRKGKPMIQAKPEEVFNKWLSDNKIKETFKRIMEKEIIIKSKKMKDYLTNIKKNLERKIRPNIYDEEYFGNTSFEQREMDFLLERVQKLETETKNIYGSYRWRGNPPTLGSRNTILKEFLEKEDNDSKCFLKTPSIIIAFLTALSEVLEEDASKETFVFNEAIGDPKEILYGPIYYGKMAEDKKSLLIENNIRGIIQNLIEQEKISGEVIEGIKSSQNKSLNVVLAPEVTEGSIRLGLTRQKRRKDLKGK